MPSPSGAWPRADPRWDPGCWEGRFTHSRPLIRFCDLQEFRGARCPEAGGVRCAGRMSPPYQALGVLSRAGVKVSRPGGSEDSGALQTARPLHARRIDFPLPCPSRSPLSRFPSCAGSMAPFIQRRSARAGVAGSAARRRAASLAGEARFALAVSVPEPEAVGGPRPAR